MSEKFVASNGIKLEMRDSGAIAGQSGKWIVNDEWAQALREFFLHERDTELGRWRWPDDPRYLVFPLKDDDEVRVLDENSGQSVAIRRSSFRPGLTHTHFAGAALAYFDTHPVSKPLPSEPRTAWVDKYGTDIWVVTAGGTLRCVDSPSSNPEKYAPFTQLVKELADAAFQRITAARRIWPEVVSDDS